MAKVKSWTSGEVGEPVFPDDFEIVKKAVLQVTDIKTNHNKYYALELHEAEDEGKTRFRVFTHYGRTDDLETNPDAGQKECRYFDTLAEAEACYESIYREKTSAAQGLQGGGAGVEQDRLAEGARHQHRRGRRQDAGEAGQAKANGDGGTAAPAQGEQAARRACRTWCATSTTRRPTP